MLHYTIELSILSKAPQVVDKSLSIGDIEIKKINHKIDIQDVIKAVKKQFSLASFPKVINSRIEEDDFRQTVYLEIQSFRKLSKEIKVTGIHESIYSLKVKEVYVK